MALIVAWALAAPTSAELQAAWATHQPAMDRLAAHALAFDAHEWARIAEGKVVKRREHIAGADRVVGLVWVDAPPEHVWLSVQEPHADPVPGMIHEDLPGSTADRRLLFQHLTLPWPLAPRQWVIEVVNNRALREATGGRVWERSWTLSEARGAAREDPKAVWLPVNDGGWFYVDIGGSTLVAYHVRSVVGGNVPDDLATRWAFGTLTGLLEGVRDRVPWVRGHYGAGHAPILRPDGAPIAPIAP